MKSARMFFFLVIAAFLLAQVEKTSADSSFLLGTLNELDDTGDEITRRGCKNIGSDAFCRRMRNAAIHVVVSEKRRTAFQRKASRKNIWKS
ncbi:hypothetical protein ACROYT_G012601 [Oculina patagonica]